MYVGLGVYVGCGVGSMLTSSGRSPAPGDSAVGVRRLTDIITGAGVLVGLESTIPKVSPKRNAMRPTKSRVTTSPDPMATHIHVLAFLGA